MVRRVLLPTLICLAPPALADCPSAPDISSEMDALFAEVQTAPSEIEARAVSGRMWAQWTQAPDDHAQALLDEGMERRAAFDLAGALIAFDALIAYCPEFAEGYNQRAFANFIRADYGRALPDLERAITLRPRHVAAIAGKGLTLLALGRVTEGQAAIRDALALNPWLAERRFLEVSPRRAL